MITAVIVGDRELIARLNAMPDRMRSGLARAITRLGLDLQRRVMGKLGGPVLKVRTGSLRSSINLRVDQSAGAISASVGTNIKYAAIHEYGGQTAPHEILPKRGRALMFEFKGETRFFRRVHHPGSKIPERSFLRSALNEMRPEIEAGLREAVTGELHR